MGLVCNRIFQPVIRLIQVVVAVIEYALIQICRNTAVMNILILAHLVL